LPSAVRKLKRVLFILPKALHILGLVARGAILARFDSIQSATFE